MKNEYKALIENPQATHLWYNSAGIELQVSGLLFEAFCRVFDHEFLDEYGFVARSLEYVRYI